MFQVLNAYLFQHKSLSIPGLGRIYLETLSASVDVADRTILPPSHQFRFDKYIDTPDRELFSYLANQLNILDYEAIKWYNEFSQGLCHRIKTEDTVDWEGIGIFKKDESGNIIFESSSVNGPFMTPTPAMRVNRQDARHTLLVGDQERTNVEMNEWLQDADAEENRKRSWWIIALVIMLAALAILGWHVYSNGWVIGNQSHL